MDIDHTFKYIHISKIWFFPQKGFAYFPLWAKNRLFPSFFLFPSFSPFFFPFSFPFFHFSFPFPSFSLGLCDNFLGSSALKSPVGILLNCVPDVQHIEYVYVLWPSLYKFSHDASGSVWTGDGQVRTRAACARMTRPAQIWPAQDLKLAKEW